MGDPQPPLVDPLLRRIYDSWKADGADVTLEQRPDGSWYIQAHDRPMATPTTGDDR